MDRAQQPRKPWLGPPEEAQAGRREARALRRSSNRRRNAAKRALAGPLEDVRAGLGGIRGDGQLAHVAISLGER